MIFFMAKKHLAILHKRYLDLILSGNKKIESRLTKIKCVPFSCVEKGDLIYFKQSGGLVRAVAKAGNVLEYKDLTPSGINSFKTKYNGGILGTSDYWRVKKNSRYAVLIWLKNVRQIGPLKIEKTNQQAWIVLNDKNSFGLP